MGVQIYILDRRTSQLDISGRLFEIGTLRYLNKASAIDEFRNIELLAAQGIRPSPAAVILADHVELPNKFGGVFRSHRILGWEAGRTHVRDDGWNFLPTLGYGVRIPIRNVYVFHTLIDDMLQTVDTAHAVFQSLVDDDYRLARHKQVIIAECLNIAHYFPGFAQADVVLSNGQNKKLMIQFEGDKLPDVSRVIGRTPRDVEIYRIID